MTNPTKENPIVKEQLIDDNKIKIVEKQYTENTTTYEKGQLESYLSEAKGKRDDIQVEIDKWEDMLKLIK